MIAPLGRRPHREEQGVVLLRHYHAALHVYAAHELDIPTLLRRELDIVIWTTGWRYADPLVSAAIGLFILPRTWKLLHRAISVLLEGTPADVNLTSVREALVRLDGVADVHDLHVWTLTSGINAVSWHVVCSGDATRDELLTRVNQVLRTDFIIAHVTVQFSSTSTSWTSGPGLR